MPAADGASYHLQVACRMLTTPRDAGLANITATYVNLLGYEAPECWVPSLLAVKA